MLYNWPQDALRIWPLAHRVLVSEEKLVLWLGHCPATLYADKVDSKEERRDSCSATEDGWRACYGQTGQLVKELGLEELSAMLTDGQGRGGRSGKGFHCANMEPLLHRTARGFVEGLEERVSGRECGEVVSAW